MSSVTCLDKHCSVWHWSYPFHFQKQKCNRHTISDYIQFCNNARNYFNVSIQELQHIYPKYWGFYNYIIINSLRNAINCLGIVKVIFLECILKVDCIKSFGMLLSKHKKAWKWITQSSEFDGQLALSATRRLPVLHEKFLGDEFSSLDIIFRYLQNVSLLFGKIFAIWHNY